MARLTRAETQARTREDVLSTARRLFLEEGFTATSMERVADAAGYSKGAVYSNFATKNDLCLEVLDRIHADQAAELVAQLGNSPEPADRVDGFARWAEKNIGDDPWTALEVEFATTTRRDVHARDELVQRRRALLSVLTLMLEAQAADLGRTLTKPAHEAASALLSLGIGIGVQRAIDPTVSVQPLVDQLRTTLGL